MRIRIVLTAMTALFLLAAQDGLPLRPHGRFTAELTGAWSGTIAGDASAERHRDGSLRIHFGQDSSQMMATDRLLMVTLAIPDGKGKRTQVIAPGKASMMFQDLKSLERKIIAGEGTLTLQGRDLLEGSFTLWATVDGKPASISGKFEKAPLVAAMD